MMSVQSLPLVDDALINDAPVAIGVSGGKDSQAAALATSRHLDAIGHGGPRLLVHSDLGSVEWNDSLPICEALAAHLGVDLLVVRRNAGDLMERWEARWRSSIRRYEDLSTVTLVPCWSTPSMRFCTSEMKTHVIRSALKRRFKGRTIVNVTGVRRAESAARARSTIAEKEKDHPIINWRPIVDWSEADVFAAIDASGLAPHPAYRNFGMSRVSCRFCIMSNVSDLMAATAQPESHDLYRRMVQLECDSSFAFQGARWLGDVAPQLLTAKQRQDLECAKHNARWRVHCENSIAPGMLYVKGWPARMLTDDEADLLAATRRNVSEVFQFNSACLDRESIHARYAELIAKRLEGGAA
jgi:3'-phosphoadenosine 5'-phosphosulfate sulfotransferase (PAPS reductase)/FAD synthetase